MTGSPRFFYFISPPPRAVSPKSAIWQTPLPMSRNLFQKRDEISISHGEYFYAVGSFLKKDGYKRISAVLSQRLLQHVDPADIRDIRIFLEKHGEFYHPARIEINVLQQKISFVLNVAVSVSGNQYIKKEYDHLKKLNDEFPISFLPQVYGFAKVESSEKPKIGMFLGEWFENYNEYHLSMDPSDNKFKIHVWDDTNRRFFLSPEQTEILYRQAARIMTYYYNVETFEHIAQWHHASGDFIVRVDNADLDVKLITVRSYSPLFHDLDDGNDEGKKAELILQALLIFFLKLSIRMQVDRIDGVGDFVWAKPSSVESTLKGMLEGLALKPDILSLPDSIETCFKYYLSNCTREDLFDLFEAMVNTFPSKSPEVPLIKVYLKEHGEALDRAIRRTLNQSAEPILNPILNTI
jgi:hypothetical protein